MTTSGGGTGVHSAPLSLMSCVRESSPQEFLPNTDGPHVADNDRNNEPSKKRRFHPFRGLRKMFRRKIRHSGSDEAVPESAEKDAQENSSEGSGKDQHRSRSTSELLAGDEPTRRKSGGGIYPGLSVSHDSVFTADHNSTSSDMEMDTAQSSSSLSIQHSHLYHHSVKAELLDVVRRRRGRGDTSEDEEDLGLPRSPCNSPTVTDKTLKEHPTKSHSTCSDGSLLSMGSSEMDEDSFGPNSRHSSKLSLHDKSSKQITQSFIDYELELESTGSLGAPLSHSAARHKMSVKPKRTHGAPRRRRNPQVTTPTALPTTLEVNEEVSVRSLTPESNVTRESMTELYSSTSMSKNIWTSNVTEQQLKSASLPPGLALPSGSNKLSRSRSNAGTKQGEVFKEEDEDDKNSKEDKKKEESFFGRFLARRSGKKQTKKSKSEDIAVIKTEQTSQSTIFKQIDERRTVSVDEIEQKVAKNIAESYTAKSENVFSFKQIDEQDNFNHNIKADSFHIKISESVEKQAKKIKSEEIKSENLEKQLKKIKTNDFNNSNENLDKIKNMYSEDTNIIKINENLVIEKYSKKTKSDDIVLKSNDIEKQSKKNKSDDYILIKTNDSMSLYKQSEERKNSIDNVRSSGLPRTGPASRQRIQPIDIPASPDNFRHNKRHMDLDLPPPTEQNISNNQVSSSPPKIPLKNSPEQSTILVDTQHSKPLVKIPSVETKHVKSSPESPSYIFEHSSLPKPIKNSPEQQSFLSHHNSPPKSRIFQVNRQIKIGSVDDKSMEIEETEIPPQITPKPHWPENSDHDKTNKIKIAGLSSYQQRVLSYNEYENSYNSLGDSYEHSVSKSHSFKSKIPNDVSITKSEASESFTSKISEDRKSIDSIEMYDSLNRNEPLSFTSHSDSIDSSADEQKDKTEVVTISCINSQILTSVNTPNQVIVNISNNNNNNNQENSDHDNSENSVSQVMITRVQLKRDIKVENKSQVPEFLKIQLNKVDIKPSNVVLSTTEPNSPTKTSPINDIEKDNIEIITRKFSKDNVEIIDKETLEETVEFSKLIQVKTEELNKKQSNIVITKNERKNSVSPPLSAKPFLKKKSNSIELTDTQIKNLIQEQDKINNIDQMNLKNENLKEKTSSAGDLVESPEPVILRRKSSASVKKDKESSDEPELMKVFARRSLKLKDSEAETLSQQVMILVENSQADENNDNTTKSRDSDKENEFSDSPQEERKKFQTTTKETKPLNESKFVETAEVTLRKPINNKIAQFNINKTTNKTSSLIATPVIDTQDIKKNNTKSYIEPKNEKPKIFEKNVCRSTKIIAFNKDMDIGKKTEINNKTKSEVITSDVITNVKNNENENDEYVPMFKRISQRKEEWEQRAQQAMKKTVP